MRAIELSVHRAAKAAPWLTESDRAALRIAKRLAETLDDLYSAGGQTRLMESQVEVASKVTYTAQTLQRYLEQLGLTARSRADLGYGTPPEEADPLAAIRDAMAEVVSIDSAG